MAEIAVKLVLEQLGKLFPLVVEEGRTLISGVHKDFADIKHELESIQAFLKDTDRRAADEGGASQDGIKTWVKQLREASFRIEDVVDQYVMYMAQSVNHLGFIALLQKTALFIKTMKPCHQIVSEIQEIKVSLRGIKERSESYKFQSENGSGSSRGTNENARFGDPRMVSHFIEETGVVGFESPRDELVHCLVEGTEECMLVVVVGMGGLGKTTHAKHVFDDQQVKQHFDCRSFITVSQSYTVRDLLIDMIQKFCKDSNEPIPKGLHTMNDITLVDEVRQYLQSKRYLVLFDDVWSEDFCDEIKHAMINNNKESRIIITTRMMPVAEYVKKSFLFDRIQRRELLEEATMEIEGNMASSRHREIMKNIIQLVNLKPNLEDRAQTNPRKGIG